MEINSKNNNVNKSGVTQLGHSSSVAMPTELLTATAGTAQGSELSWCPVAHWNNPLLPGAGMDVKRRGEERWMQSLLIIRSSLCPPLAGRTHTKFGWLCPCGRGHSQSWKGYCFRYSSIRRGSGSCSTCAVHLLMRRRHRCCRLGMLSLRPRGRISFRCTAAAAISFCRGGRGDGGG